MTLTREQKEEQKKSAMRILEPGELLFKEKDQASSMFIIQSGQLRLFKPKGRGYVELAVLRSGEVLGEMAYFDERSPRRSCSAEAISPTEVIEISFKAFDKTIQGLAPWLRTIIKTLSDRLRHTNEMVKRLDSNSIALSTTGGVGEYKFFHNADIIKLLSITHLVAKGDSILKDGLTTIPVDKLKFYCVQVFTIKESKFVEFLELLVNEGLIELVQDEQGLDKIIKVFDVDVIRDLLVFQQTQRMLDDEKKISISYKCEMFLRKIREQLELNGTFPVTSSGEPATAADWDWEVAETAIVADVSEIVAEFDARNAGIDQNDLKDAIHHNLLSDVMVTDAENGVLSCKVNYFELEKQFPCISFMNSLRRINEKKNHGSAY